MPALILALLGLCVGVFVEGVVSSYHYDESFLPWPRCRACGCPAPPIILLPFAGYLRAPRCVGCKRGHIVRAMQVQLATAAVFFVLGGQYWGQPWLLLVSLVESCLLVAVLFIDLELRLIPTALVAVLVLLALGSAMAWPGMGLPSALLGGAIGYLSFGVLVLLAHVAFGEGALGMGDANLALAIGCITGYPLVVFALSAGVFLGGIGALFMMTVGRLGLRGTMPYGPYLVLAVLFVLAHGNTANPLVHLEPADGAWAHGISIRCNAMLPGTVETPMTYSTLPPDLSRDLALQREGDLAPLGRVAQAAEIAEAVAFLRFVTCEDRSKIIG